MSGPYQRKGPYEVLQARLPAGLQSLEDLATVGLVVKQADGTLITRTITGTANEVSVANGDGAAGNPVISLPSAIVLTGKTLTGGAFTGGTWDNGVIGGITPAAITGTNIKASGRIAASTTIGANAQNVFEAAVDGNATSGTTQRGVAVWFSPSAQASGAIEGYTSFPTTRGTTNTFASLVHYRAAGVILGTGDLITSVFGFRVDAAAIPASTTTGYAYQGLVASGTGRRNLSMTGTAVNVLVGNLQVGSETETAGAEKLQVTGTASISSTLAMAGAITSSFSGAFFDHNVSSTSAQYLEAQNTGGRLNLGVSSSTGAGILSTGGVAYSTVLNSVASTAVQLGVANTARLTATTSGVDITGAATVSTTLGVTGNTTLTGNLAVNGGDITTTASTLNIGNTVIGMVFGGVRAGATLTYSFRNTTTNATGVKTVLSLPVFNTANGTMIESTGNSIDGYKTNIYGAQASSVLHLGAGGVTTGHLRIASTGNITLTNTLSVTGATTMASETTNAVGSVGGSTAVGLTLASVFSSANATGLSERGTYTATSGSLSHRARFATAGGIVLNTGGVVDLATTMRLDEPNITVSTGSLTEAATLYIAAAPTEGASNWALKVASGNTSLGGDLAVNGGDLTTSASTFNLLASPTTVTIGAAATTASIGAATGTFTVNNATLAAKDIRASAGGVFTISDAVTNAVTDVFGINHFTSGTAAAGFGAALVSSLESSAGTTRTAARISVLWTTATDGAEVSAITISPRTGGALSPMLYVAPKGIEIGGTALRSTTQPTNALSLFDGIAPVGTLTNGVTFYSTAGEARVMDAAGNATLLSPHEKVTNKWIYHSEDTRSRRVLKIDMEDMMRRLDAEFDLGMVHEYSKWQEPARRQRNWGHKTPTSKLSIKQLASRVAALEAQLNPS